MLNPHRAGRLAMITFAAGLLAAGCGGQEAGDDVTATESALYDATSMDASALLALPDAQRRTIEEGNLYEFCGLIIKKTSGYRGTVPSTTYEPMHCEQRFDLGTPVVGFYHSHPKGNINGFSDEDKAEAKKKHWTYYLISSDNCRRRFDWQTGVTKVLGCV